MEGRNWLEEIDAEEPGTNQGAPALEAWPADVVAKITGAVAWPADPEPPRELTLLVCPNCGRLKFRMSDIRRCTGTWVHEMVVRHVTYERKDQ